MNLTGIWLQQTSCEWKAGVEIGESELGEGACFTVFLPLAG